mgnify:CR=1 FL=1
MAQPQNNTSSKWVGPLIGWCLWTLIGFGCAYLFRQGDIKQEQITAVMGDPSTLGLIALSLLGSAAVIALIAMLVTVNVESVRNALLDEAKGFARSATYMMFAYGSFIISSVVIQSYYTPQYFLHARSLVSGVGIEILSLISISLLTVFFS